MLYNVAIVGRLGSVRREPHSLLSRTQFVDKYEAGGALKTTIQAVCRFGFMARKGRLLDKRG
jgi:hypothetical protein